MRRAAYGNHSRCIQQGISLIELALAAAMMALLFFSGLQLLSTFMTVQQHLSGPENTMAIAPMLLNARLENTLSDAEDVLPDAAKLSLTFQRNHQSYVLHFEAIRNGWNLFLDDQLWAHWPKAMSTTSPGFELSRKNLLTVQLPVQNEPMRVWLRNVP